MSQALTVVPSDPAPRRRLTALNRKAVGAARAVLLRELEEVGFKCLNPTIITEAVCRAFIEVDRVKPERTHGISENAKAIAAMQVGEEVVFENTTRHRIHAHYATARNILDNPDAVWVLRREGKGCLVKRLEDGAPPISLPRSEITRLLISMGVGDSTLLKLKSRLSPYYKEAARFHLGAFDADWSTRKTNLGIRITRVK